MADTDVQGLLIRIEATTAQMRQELARGESAVSATSKSMDASLGNVDKAFDRAGDSAKNLQSVIASAASSFGGFNIAAAASVAGLVALTSSTIDHAREVKNQAFLANTSVEEFQRMAYGAKSVGIEQDKLSDIFKDVNDRIGEFIQRGGGEMADFFKEIGPKIGVTAEQFRNLSGPQALQLYYSSLEKAGLGQQQMHTYMEAMANDSTALSPLLQNNGKGFKEMGERADQLGLIISKFNIDRLVDAGRAVGDLQSTFTSAGQQLVVGMLPAIESVTSALAKMRDDGGAQKLGEVIAFLAENIDVLAAALGGKMATAFAKFAFDAVASAGTASKAFLENAAAIQATALATAEGTAVSAANAAAKLRESVATVAATTAIEAEAVARVANLTAVRDGLLYQAALAKGSAGELTVKSALATVEAELAVAKTLATKATEAQVVASTAAAGAVARDTVATQANTAAQLEAAAAKGLLARAGSGLLGMLGGPAGVAALAIGAGAAFLIMGGNAKAAETNLDDLKRSVEDVRKEFLALTKDQQRATIVTTLRQQEQAATEADSAYADFLKTARQVLGSTVGTRVAGEFDTARKSGNGFSDTLDDIQKRLHVSDEGMRTLVTAAAKISTLDGATGQYRDRVVLLRKELDSTGVSTKVHTGLTAEQSKVVGDLQKALEKQLHTLEDKTALEGANRVLTENKISAQSKEGQALLTTAAAIDKQKAADQAATKAKSDSGSASKKAATEEEARTKALNDLQVQSQLAITAAQGMAAAYLDGTDKSREFTLQQKVEEALLKTGADARKAVEAAIYKQRDAEDKLAVSKSAYDLQKETTDLIAQATAQLQGTEALKAYNLQKSMTIALAGKNIEVSDKEYQQLLEANKAQQEAVQIAQQAANAGGIMDRLYPEAKLLKDYTEDQKALNAAMALYPENAGAYQTALSKLGQEYEVNRSKATIWGQMTEAAIDRIDGVFASAWGNIGDGAESLWDNLKKGFKQTLGEIAHMLTTKPLLASISNWLTGTDNGQGLGSVWSKILSSVGGSSSSGGGLAGLFGSTSSSSSSSGGGLGGAVGMLKDAYSAYSSATGVGSAIVSGYASGGISGAISGGFGYYSSMLSSLGTTITGGISSVVSAIASSTAATTAAQFTSAGVVSGAFAQVGATLATSTTTTAASLAPVYGQAAMQLGQAATPQIVGAGSGSAFAAWPLLVLMGMYQSGKLFDAGVRPDGDNLQATGGDTALGKAAMFGPATGARWLEFKDNLFSKVVGGKIAAMMTGSTVFQAVYEKVGAKLFGSAYETKDSGIALGVTDGDLNAQQYIDQKKKGGWISGSTKKRTLYGELADEAEYGLQGTYMATQIGVAELVSRIGISVTDGAFDGLQIAQQKISTQDKTQEEIKTAVDAWFVSASDAMIAALDAGSGGFGYSFEELARRINVFESFNASINMINLGVLDLSANSMELANALVIASGNSEQFNTNISGYYDKFFSETEKADDVLEAVNKQFAAMNITFPSSREEYRKLVESITDLNSAEGQKMFLSLTYAAEMASSAYDILEQRATDATAATKALADSLLANVDTAMSAVSKAVSAEQNALTEAYNARAASLNDMLSTAQGNVSDLTSVSSSLSEALKALNGTSDETVRMLRNQAQATLQSALATVRAGGTLANMTGLDDALDVVSSNTTDLYSSLEDFNRDQGRTANVVAELNNINGVQLSTQEQLLKTVQDQIDQAKEQYDDQMKALDDQLALAQAQVDALNGIDNSVLSVKDAIAGLGAAIAAAMANAAGAKGAASTAASAVASYTGSGGAPSQSDLNAIYQSVLGRDADFAGLSYWSGVAGGSGLTAAQLASQIQADAIKNGEIQAHAAGGLITGPGTGTSDSILSRLSNGEYVMRAAAVSAYGTDMLDQMNSLRMPVGENGPTLEVTAPSRVFSSSQSSSAFEGGGSTAQLEQKVDVLIDVVKQIVGPMKLNSDENSKLMKKWDRIGLSTKQVKEGA